MDQLKVGFKLGDLRLKDFLRSETLPLLPMFECFKLKIFRLVFPISRKSEHRTRFLKIPLAAHVVLSADLACPLGIRTTRIRLVMQNRELH